MKIGNIEFKNNLILAPMAGITDIAFRSLCVDFGADAGVSEMISAKALHYRNEKTEDLLKIAPNEGIKIIQLFGHEPDIMAEICASDYVQPFDIIDINMGCPAPKIVSNKDGSSLMTNIPLARDIISACVGAIDKPITVKFRSGYSADNINAVEFAKMCEEAGASAITIHPRTREQMYSGKADWEMIRKVKESVSIPVIASGDVVDKESFDRVLSETGCDAVMIGRGALGNPEIFSEITGKPVTMNKVEIIEKHIAILRENFSENFISGHIRKHLLWYLKGEKNVSELKVYVSTEPDLDKCVEAIRKHFENK
ncbi:MAG: tRNA dihydrouridine synthase DusB [Clostridiales bacterium]|nr:tRNA dihydrouridine synthase DusB [Clostridiales bacterium]